MESQKLNNQVSLTKQTISNLYLELDQVHLSVSELNTIEQKLMQQIVYYERSLEELLVFNQDESENL